MSEAVLEQEHGPSAFDTVQAVAALLDPLRLGWNLFPSTAVMDNYA